MESQPAGPAGDSDPLIPPSRPSRHPKQTRGKAGPRRRLRLVAPAGRSDGLGLHRCLFLDRDGLCREVWLDCLPARFVRCELATTATSGMLRRQWVGVALVGARAVYVELEPQRVEDPQATVFKKRLPRDPDDSPE